MPWQLTMNIDTDLLQNYSSMLLWHFLVLFPGNFVCRKFKVGMTTPYRHLICVKRKQ